VLLNTQRYIVNVDLLNHALEVCVAPQLAAAVRTGIQGMRVKSRDFLHCKRLARMHGMARLAPNLSLRLISFALRRLRFDDV
jgi:hypothetical protein